MPVATVVTHIVGALINLNTTGRYLHWGVIQVSVANAVVIALMVVVFILAVTLPFPHQHRSSDAKATGETTTEEDKS